MEIDGLEILFDEDAAKDCIVYFGKIRLRSYGMIMNGLVNTSPKGFNYESPEYEFKIDSICGFKEPKDFTYEDFINKIVEDKDKGHWCLMRYLFGDNKFCEYVIAEDYEKMILLWKKIEAIKNKAEEIVDKHSYEISKELKNLHL